MSSVLRLHGVVTSPLRHAVSPEHLDADFTEAGEGFRVDNEITSALTLHARADDVQETFVGTKQCLELFPCRFLVDFELSGV